MYREEILDHYKRPRNEGELEKGLEAEGENPSCGDHTHIYLKVSEDRLEKMRHKTKGCAISTAAISILSQEIEDKKIEEVKELDKDWMLEKLGIEVTPMRMKCVLLGLETVQKALSDSKD